MPRFRRHAVCSPLTLASEIGLQVLGDGGNAVDAALATGLALAVAYPHMCGAGGDLLAMVWADGALHGLVSAGRLPMGAPSHPDTVPMHGIGSATVPGAPAGWRALAERWATRPLATLAAPAVRLARDGIERSPGLVRMTAWFRDLLARDAEAARIFLADGPLRQPDLAATLEALDRFYDGPVAAHAPAPFRPGDFAAHEAAWVRPLRVRFAGLDVAEMPPPSRGGIALDALRLLDGMPPGDPGEPAFQRRLIRASRAATPGGDTIFLAVVDERGMAVALSQSLYMAFGSGVVVQGTGVLLHNRAAYLPSARYRPGARPVHTLAPAMALAAGRPRLVFGTMGGEAQVQIHVQLLARLLLGGESVEAAVAAPRWVHDGTTLLVEDGLPAVGDLDDFAVRALEMPELAGHAHVIAVGPDGLEAAADPRSDGVAVGA